MLSVKLGITMRKLITIKTHKQFTDITDILTTIVKDFGGSSGLINVFVCHTTCGLSILEDELLSLSDILDFLDNIIPIGKKYRHDCIGIRDVPVDERVNGVSHVRMLLFSSSITIPFNNNGLCFGKWQRVFLVEMDWCVPFRDREIVITVTEDKI